MIANLTLKAFHNSESGMAIITVEKGPASKYEVDLIEGCLKVILKKDAPFFV